jgi:hypothetical protein
MLKKHLGLAAFFAFMLLQLPTPYGQSGKVKRHPPDSTAASGPTQPNTDQRGTKESPLVVDTEKSGQTAYEASENKRHDDEAATQNNREFYLTLAIAIAAFLQVAGIAAQVCVYLKQSRLMGLSLAATEKAANAAETSANAAMGVAVPTLAILEFSIGSQQGEELASAVVSALQYPRIGITLKNYGQSPAFIKGCSVMVDFREIANMPTNPYYSVAWNRNDVIDPNGSFVIENGIPTLVTAITNDDVIALLRREKHLTIYGVFYYGNIFNSSTRELKFCKRLEDYGAMDTWNPVVVDEKQLPRYID